MNKNERARRGVGGVAQMKPELRVRQVERIAGAAGWTWVFAAMTAAALLLAGAPGAAANGKPQDTDLPRAVVKTRPAERPQSDDTPKAVVRSKVDDRPQSEPKPQADAPKPEAKSQPNDRPRADVRTRGDDQPLMAILPPTVRLPSAGRAESPKIDPARIMAQIVPRVAGDAARRKWPFKILPADTVDGDYQPAETLDGKTTDESELADLKPLAEKIDCRYLVIFRVNELVATNKDELFSHTLHARANIDLSVYDRDKDSYVWQTNKIAETRHPQRPGNVGLRREEDGALNMALTQALEPFARGERRTTAHRTVGRRGAEPQGNEQKSAEQKSVEDRTAEQKSADRQRPNIVVTVQKVLSDGKRVLLDAGVSSRVEVGDVLKSIESDLEVKIVEVLDNGSIAEVIAGSPQAREVLKHK